MVISCRENKPLRAAFFLLIVYAFLCLSLCFLLSACSNQSSGHSVCSLFPFCCFFLSLSLSCFFIRFALLSQRANLSCVSHAQTLPHWSHSLLLSTASESHVLFLAHQSFALFVHSSHSYRLSVLILSPSFAECHRLTTSVSTAAIPDAFRSTIHTISYQEEQQ